MNAPIKWAPNRMPASDDRNLSIMSLPNIAKLPPRFPDPSGKPGGDGQVSRAGRTVCEE